MENKPKNDPVNHPAHYTAGGIECIDAIAAALTCQRDPMQAWLTGQVLKYLWRWPLKNGAEDLRKAQFYLNRLVEALEKAETIRRSRHTRGRPRSTRSITT